MKLRQSQKDRLAAGLIALASVWLIGNDVCRHLGIEYWPSHEAWTAIGSLMAATGTIASAAILFKAYKFAVAEFKWKQRVQNKEFKDNKLRIFRVIDKLIRIAKMIEELRRMENKGERILNTDGISILWQGTAFPNERGKIVEETKLSVEQEIYAIQRMFEAHPKLNKNTNPGPSEFLGLCIEDFLQSPIQMVESELAKESVPPFDRYRHWLQAVGQEMAIAMNDERLFGHNVAAIRIINNFLERKFQKPDPEKLLPLPIWPDS